MRQCTKYHLAVIITYKAFLIYTYVVMKKFIPNTILPSSLFSNINFKNKSYDFICYNYSEIFYFRSGFVLWRAFYNMTSRSTRTQVHVKQCSQCQGNTEYHCRTCRQNKCPSCKRTHTISLDTKDHNVTLYREKFSSFYKINSIISSIRTRLITCTVNRVTFSFVFIAMDTHSTNYKMSGLHMKPNEKKPDRLL